MKKYGKKKLPSIFERSQKMKDIKEHRLDFIVIGAFLALGIFWVFIKPSDSLEEMVRWSLVMGSLAGIILLMVGVLGAIDDYLKKDQKIICPFCGMEMKVYVETKQFDCCQCKKPLLINLNEPISIFDCLFCNNKIAASKNYDGEVQCDKCGFEMELLEEKFIKKNLAYQCPFCKNETEKIFYCLVCGSILNEKIREEHLKLSPLKRITDKEKSPILCLIKAKIIIELNNNELKPLLTDRLLFYYLTSIDYILKLLEYSIAHSKNLPLIIPLLKEVDIQYAKILKSLNSPAPSTPLIEIYSGVGCDDGLEDKINDIIINNMHINRRNSIIKKLKDIEPAINFIDWKKFNIKLGSRKIKKVGPGHLDDISKKSYDKIIEYAIENRDSYIQFLESESTRILKFYNVSEDSLYEPDFI